MCCADYVCAAVTECDNSQCTSSPFSAPKPYLQQQKIIPPPSRGSKAKGTPLVTTKGKAPSSKLTSKSTDTESTSHGGGTEKGGVVGGEIMEDSETDNVINTSKQPSTEDADNAKPLNHVGKSPDLNGGLHKMDHELCSVLNAFIDPGDTTTSATIMRGLRETLDVLGLKYTHARVMLSYMNGTCGQVEIRESAFVASPSQCHLIISALCSHVTCTRVKVTVHLLNL